MKLQCLKCNKIIKAETEEQLQINFHKHLIQINKGCKPKVREE